MRGPSNQVAVPITPSGPWPSVQHGSWGGRGRSGFPGPQPRVEELSDGPRKSFGSEGLLEKAAGAFFKSRMEADIVDVAGDEENFQVGFDHSEVLGHLSTAHTRHDDVRQQQIENARLLRYQ